MADFSEPSYSNRSPGEPQERSPPQRRSPGRNSSENKGNTLYVSGLSSRTRTDDLTSLFSKYGHVVDCKLVTEPRTNESRGFGFVTMESGDEAEDCIQSLNRTELDGRLITVEKARRGKSRSPTPGRYLGRAREDRDSYRDYPRGGYSRDRYDRSYERGYDRYDRSYDRDYDRYDRSHDRYDRSYDRYDRGYDRYDRDYGPTRSRRREESPTPYERSRHSPRRSPRHSPRHSPRRSPGPL